MIKVPLFEAFAVRPYELLDKANCWPLVAHTSFKQVSLTLSNSHNGMRLLSSSL